MKSVTARMMSRWVRLAGAGLLALGLLGDAQPAQALVSQVSGDWQFSLYADTGCSGDHIDAIWSDGLKTVSEPDLRDVSFNDKASSWSFCNGSTKTAAVSISLFTDVSYGGTEIDSGTLTVPSGQCMVKNTISSDNAVSSFKVVVILY